jgi:hypothetical protein
MYLDTEDLRADKLVTRQYSCHILGIDASVITMIYSGISGARLHKRKIPWIDIL